MNKHVIMQKLLKNEDVSDSLFRKIYQILDIADSNDVEKLVEIFKEMYPETEEIHKEPIENESENTENQSENSEKSDEKISSGAKNSENKIESQVNYR